MKSKLNERIANNDITEDYEEWKSNQILVEESMKTKHSSHYKPSAFVTDRENSSDSSIQKEKSYRKWKH